MLQKKKNLILNISFRNNLITIILDFECGDELSTYMLPSAKQVFEKIDRYCFFVLIQK